MKFMLSKSVVGGFSRVNLHSPLLVPFSDSPTIVINGAMGPGPAFDGRKSMDVTGVMYRWLTPEN